MQTINIFIASSYEMKEWREVIGHKIRQWSDKYEAHGIRLKMLCWEDFAPEYTGERKQNQYNENLVVKSQIFIALFHQKCGAYTQEEIKLGKEHCKNHIHVFTKEGTSAKVEEYIKGEKLKGITCSNEEDLCTRLHEAILNYINVANIPYHAVTGSYAAKFIYATIPNDRSEYRYSFSNMIRSLDDIAEDQFGLRLKLLQDNIPLIVESDYYTAILKDSLCEKDIDELKTAINGTSDSGKPGLTLLYYNHEDKVMENYPSIGKLVSEKEIFNSEFRHLDTVRYNLFLWLCRNKFSEINKATGLSTNNGWLMFNMQKIVPLSTLKIDEKDDSHVLAKTMDKIINDFYTRNISASMRSSRPIDTKKLKRSINNIIKATNKSKESFDLGITHQIRERETITNRIDYILQNFDLTLLEELADTLRIRESIERELVKHNIINFKELLETQMLIAHYYENYTRRFTDDVRDSHYLHIINTADHYNYINPHVEIARMNYANALSRRNKHKEALEYYNKAIGNLKQADDGSLAIRTYITHIYITLINSYIDLGYIKNALALANDFKAIISSWTNLPWPVQLATRTKILSSFIRLEKHNENWQQILPQAYKMKSLLDESDENDYDLDDWEELFIDFPICLAAFIIDTNTSQHKCHNELMAIFEYIGQKLDNEKFKRLEPSLQMHQVSQFHHNVGYHYMGLGDITKARESYKKALYYRQQKYNHTQNTEDLKGIAETLTNIGASYVDDPQKDKYSQDEINYALEASQKALDIYTELGLEGHPEQITEIFKAKLLKGTVLFSFFPQHKEEGKRMIKDCLIYTMKNPHNSYASTFQYTCMKYLTLDDLTQMSEEFKKNGLIVKIHNLR